MTPLQILLSRSRAPSFGDDPPPSQKDVFSTNVDAVTTDSAVQTSHLGGDVGVKALSDADFATWNAAYAAWVAWNKAYWASQTSTAAAPSTPYSVAKANITAAMSMAKTGMGTAPVILQPGDLPIDPAPPVVVITPPALPAPPTPAPAKSSGVGTGIIVGVGLVLGLGMLLNR